MTTLKQIDKKIATITTSAAKLNGMIHEVGMDILNHAKDHGDCTRALALALAMPASMRRTMIISWFNKHSPIIVKLSDKGNAVGYSDKFKKLTAEEKLGAWKLEEAAAYPFWQMAEDEKEAAKPLDFEALMKMVTGLAKRIDAAVKEGKVAPGDIQNAEAISRAVSGLKVDKIVPEMIGVQDNGAEGDDVRLKAVA